MKQHYHTHDFIFFVRQRSSDIPIIREVIDDDNYKIRNRLKAQDIVIDIGGHIGTFSIYAASMGAVVLTYEAVQRNFDILKENVEINGFPVEIHKTGVMATEGTRRVYVRDFNFGGSNFYSEHNNPDFYEEVECTTLDKIFKENNLTHCDFLKLDCEGSELEILESFSDLKLIKTIAFEYQGAERRETIKNLLSKTHDLVNYKGDDNLGTMIYEIKWEFSTK